MSDLPPLPEGFVVENDPASYDPMKDILSSGFDFTNGYRTPEDIQRLKAEGYSPAPHSKHLEGDAIDLVPGKSGKSLSDVEQEAQAILSRWSAGGKVLNEGDHIHLQLNGWGQAPGTPGTPYSGMPDLPPGFELAQRGAVSKASIEQPRTQTPDAIAPPPDTPFQFDDAMRKQILDYIPKAKSPDDLRAFASQVSGGKGTIGNPQDVLDNYRSGHRDFSFVAGSMPQDEGPSLLHTAAEATKSFGRGVVEGVAGIGDIILDPILQTPERIGDLYYDLTGQPEKRMPQEGGVLTTAANRAADAVVGAPDPQSTLERYTNAAARVAGNFAVPFGAAGKENAVRSVAGDLIAGSVSGVSGEAAHDIAPAIGVDPETARTVGQLVGGFAGAPLAARAMGRNAEEVAAAPPEGKAVDELPPMTPEATDVPPMPEGFIPEEQARSVPPIDPEMLRKVNGGHTAQSAAMEAEPSPSVTGEIPRQRDTIDVNQPLNPQPGTAEQRAAAAATSPEDVLPSAPVPAEQAPLSEVAKAGNINLAKIETPEDIDALMRVTSDAFGGFQAERRGVQKWEATQALADDLGMTPDDLLHRRTGQAFNAEEALAARNLLAASAEETRSLAQKAATGDEQAKAAFVKSFLLHAAITEQAAGAAAEAGRALNIYRKVAKAGIGDREAMQDAMKRLQSGASPEEIADLINALPNDPTALNRFARDAIKPRFKDKLMFVWINALLSGPKTHIVNVASNLVTAAMDVPEQALAAYIGGTRVGARVLAKGGKMKQSELAGIDRIMFSEIGPRFYGTLRGAAEGLASARVALKSAEAGGKVEAFRPAIGGVAGHVISTPTKLLNAEDEFFKSMARRSELAGLAVRKARMEGLKGDAMRERINVLLAHPTDEMLDAAADAALYKTYQRPLGARMTKLANVINEWQWPKLFIPFMRTPVNLLKYAIERSPAAPFLKEVRDEFTKGGAARDLAIARMTMGTGVGMLVASLASQGRITGNGPADPSAKRALQANGWQPYSIKVGDQWISYRRLDPWATVMGTAADTVEMQSRMTDKQQQDAAALVIGATTKNLASKTWLSGLGDLVDAVTDPQANAKSTLTRLAASMATPTLAGQIAQAVDPVYRDTNDPTYLGQLRKKIEARIPGASENIIPRRDILGKPVTNEQSAVERLMSPFDRGTQTHDPVAQAIYDSGARFSVPSRKVAGGSLPDEAYDTYQQVSAQYFYDDMKNLLADPDWATMTRDERAKEIERLKDGSRKDARADLFGLDH